MKTGVVEAVKSSSLNTAKSKKKAETSKQVEERKEREIAELVLSHRENGRKLARSILRRWRVRMPADEIDSIVDLALCEAARRFSEEHGATFMTFLFYHLRGHLVRAVTRAAQASNVFMSYGQNNGVDTAEWQHLGADGVWPYLPDHYLFSQRDIATPEHELLRKERINQCRSAITKLDELEKEIVSRSFSDEQALVDIARSLGYSRCHISRVKKIALDRLRALLGTTVETHEKEAVVEPKVSARTERNAVDRTKNARRRSRRRSIGKERQSGLKLKSRAA